MIEQSITEWEDGWRVRLPLPFQLRWIYAYILRDEHGYTIIDCGLNYEEAWETWRAVFQHLNIQMKHIDRIVLTHYHPDHYGLTGRLQQETGAQVWLSPMTEEQARIVWGDAQEPENVAAFYERHGLPKTTSLSLITHFRRFTHYVSPHPVKPKRLAAGETYVLGDRTYEVWHTPGHAEDHHSFYDPDRQWLIGGDVLLQKITPNVSLHPHGDPNPLLTYLTTLQKLSERPIRKVLPAHGPLFTDVQQRINEIVVHHENRLQLIERIVQRSQTAYDVCLHLFGDRLSVHNLRFAIAETLAHLEYLRIEGRLSLKDKAGICYYQAES